MEYRDALRAAVKGVEVPEVVEVGDDAQRVAQRLRDSLIWPERALEVKKEAHRQQVRDEAQDG